MNYDEDRDILLLLWLRRRRRRNIQQRRAPRWWVRPILTNRNDQGAYHNLVHELRQDPELFFNYHRMMPREFDTPLNKIEPMIAKVHLTREPISCGSRLSLTLRYIASGDSMTSLHYQYRIGKSTVSKIIAETTEAIWKALQPEVLVEPTEENWRRIAEDYSERWNFPNCVGSIDGKHIQVQCYNNSGSTFYNYKGTYSIVLLAACDAQYRFTYVSIGSAGRESDGGIFQSSDFGRSLLNETLPLPPPEALPGSNIRLPHVFVGDAAFPLIENLMRPYPGLNLSPDQVIFNYRLSRARMTIENTFGVLASRMRIFRRPIHASPDTVDNIVKCCVVLHNWLRDIELNIAPGGRRYIPPRYIDRVDRFGNVQPGEWREDTVHQMALGCLQPNAARNSTTVAKNVRAKFTEYFVQEGIVPWQWQKLPYFLRPEVRAMGNNEGIDYD